jgi:hypothetical protein
MIKIYYINDNDEVVYVQSCKTVKESLNVDYYVWKAIHKECIFGYKEYIHSICQENDFVDNEKDLEEWISLMNKR